MDQGWRNEAVEAAILEDISTAEPWALLEEFSQLTRLSGSEDEAKAAKYITDKLEAWGVPHQAHYPTTLISLPGPATLKTLGDDSREYRVKTTSFSPQTGGEEVTAELVYVAASQAAGMDELFGEQRHTTDMDLSGKIVMTEGLGIAARGFDLATSGAVAALFINPGENIHEGITTTSWGSPDVDSTERGAPIPIITINNPDGQELIQKLAEGPVEVAFSNQVETGWRQIAVIVAEIEGTEFPDEFVLFHGHLDSWHVGIGDNATGDATLLELARVFWNHRESLKRSLRVAWWSGHSHGRYAGSTWYADAFALDLMANCVSHVNCDSPGCRWATVYEGVSWMSEAEGFCQAVIRDITGLEATGEGHVLRAGDCSFNNLGVTTYFMLSSTMPEELRQEKGYYAVEGCGANIAWHTEDDTMAIADRDNLERDLKVYAATLLRSLNAPVAPFDYRATVDELAEAVAGYQEAAGEVFSLAASQEALLRLRAALDGFYAATAGLDADTAPATLRRVNAAQRAIGRTLVALGYTRDGRFRQDPARTIPTLPDLAFARDIPEADEDQRNVLAYTLVRGQNRLIWEAGQAAQIASQAASMI